jgi:hypothetical protein
MGEQFDEEVVAPFVDRHHAHGAQRKQGRVIQQGVECDLAGESSAVQQPLERVHPWR